MEAIIAILAAIAGAGAALGYTKIRTSSAQTNADQIIADAKANASEIVLNANKTAKKEMDEMRCEIKRQENKVAEREHSMLKKLDELDQRSEKMRQDEQEINDIKDQARRIREQTREKLERVAGLSREEAAERVMNAAKKETKNDLMSYITKAQRDAEAEVEQKAEMLLVTTMERMASDVTAERTVTAIELPDDNMKGRIIGKEGRNIQALQRATGVDVLVDDTLGMIVLSSFDPVRRQVARLSVEMLMKDGRIHPARIEEVVEKARKQIDREVVRAGEDAARECGVVGIPPELIHLLGELKFRTSYGQNVLKHSTEMAQMAGMLAEEVGADVRITKTATLLHDMGKAVTHRIEGKHHHIGAELARKYGMDERICHAIEAHHDDIEATTPEAVIVRVCDALSAARPGARNISAENFASRMKELENVATSFDGVDKAYAISAGREVRVIVRPAKIDDLSAVGLARDIANKIESTMQYPGTIKVNVIRETRAIEYAK